MKSHRILGGGGVQLHVVENGNPRGRPIVFLHGASQCSLQWSRQMESSLARTYRLLALDLRGHGLSGKPSDAYRDSRQWADDLDAYRKLLVCHTERDGEGRQTENVEWPDEPGGGHSDSEL